MANYVKFMRGSPTAYQQLQEANQLNDDTLYFIYQEDASDGELYLGSKLIAGAEGLASLSDIEINVEALADKQVLTYDAGSGKWVNTTVEEAVNEIFVGATSLSSGIAGLVPAPAAGQTNLFLRSDGNWSEINTSNTSTSLTGEYPITISENGVITLQIDNAILDIVNNSLTVIGYDTAENKAVLTKTDNGVEWIIPDNSAIENLETTVEVISADVNKLKDSVGQAAEYDSDGVETTPPSGLYAEISNLESKINNTETDIDTLQQNILDINKNIDDIQDDVSELDKTAIQLSNDIVTINSQITSLTANKANASEVYTKTETLEQIESAIASVDHLKRTVVSSTETIDLDLPTADEYIYMVPNAKGTYDEYMVIDGELEKVGDWETDLTGYATKADLENVNETIEELDEALSNEIERAKNAEEANATAISDTQSTANTASANATSALNQINDLTAVVNNKVNQVYSSVPVIDPNSASTTVTEEEFATGEYFIETSTGGYVKADTYVAGTTYYTQVKDDESGDLVFNQVAHTLLTPDDRAKLDKLVFDDDGSVSVSGNINISQVQGLDGYLNETHFAPSVVAKLNYITAVDNNFIVDSGTLKLNSTVGRLLTADEADKIVKATNGEYNFIKSVNQGEFKVTNGNLSLENVPVSSLTAALGDLTSLESDVVTSIVEINERLTWGEIAELTVSS